MAKKAKTNMLKAILDPLSVEVVVLFKIPPGMLVVPLLFEQDCGQDPSPRQSAHPAIPLTNLVP
jgi:hypothetical protein